MPYIKREDGFNATQVAHRGNALGGLNEVTRDKSIDPGDPQIIVFWTTSDDIQPGDEVCGGDGCTPEENAAAHDAIAGPLSQLTYERLVIPANAAAVRLSQESLSTLKADILAAPSLPEFMADEGTRRLDNLQNQLVRLEEKEARDNTELATITDDVITARSVRVERLRDSDRPGCTFESLEDCLVGESVCQERK